MLTLPTILCGRSGFSQFGEGKAYLTYMLEKSSHDHVIQCYAVLQKLGSLTIHEGTLIHGSHEWLYVTKRARSVTRPIVKH